MSGVKIKVTFTNDRAALSYLSKVMDKLKKPDLNKSVNRVGKYWVKNFKGEGSAVGGWAGLADSTIANRESQGYGSGPIMYRYGSLYRMSAAFFANQVGSTTRSERTPYDKRGHSTTAKLSLQGNTATLHVGGPKVYNQWPGPKTGRPARPFWVFDQGMHKEARQGVVDWLVEDVILGRSG